MAKTAAERMKEYRSRKRNVQRNGVTKTDYSVTLPELPRDEVISCNSGIGWSDVMAMSRSDIDYVYGEWRKVGGDILLRLRRSAGYWQRRTRA